MNTFVKRVWPIGIIGAIWLLFAFPYWGNGKVPFPSTYLVTFFAPWSATHGMPVKNNAMPDVITQIYPWKRLTIDAWKHGELPLWNPYSFAGTSHVGNYQSAVFSPINLLFYFLPEIHAWSVMILLQPILAGLFMYVFLRSLMLRRVSSVMGSIAYMFCGFMVVWMAYGTLGFAVLFLPLILYGVNIFVTKGYSWAAALFSFSLGLSFLSGHFQMSLYVLAYTVSFLLYLFIRSKEKKRALSAGAFIFVGVCLAAPQILPAYDSYTQAMRSSLFNKGEVIPWQYLVTIFSPDFYGNPVTRNDWFGHYAEWASFIGVVPLLLSLLALFVRSRDGWVRYFFVMTLFPLLLAFQTPLLDLFYALHIPVLSTSSASRIVVLVSFSLAALSGFGLDRLIEIWDKRAWKRSASWFISVTVFIVLFWSVLLLMRPLPSEKLMVAIRNSYLPTFIFGLTLGFAGLGFVLHKRLKVILPFILVVMAAFEMYRFAAKWMPFDAARYMYPELAVITKLQSLVAKDQARVFGNIGNEVGSAFGIPLIEGYDAVYQYRYGKFISAAATGAIGQVQRSVVMLDKHGAYSQDTLDLLGTRYYVHKKSDGRFPWAYPFWELPQYQLIWEDDNFQIFENTKSLPRAFLASSYTKETGDNAILKTLFSPAFDRNDALVLEEDPAIKPEKGTGKATIISDSTQEISIEVTTEVPKLLFISDVYDKGWRVSVDGKNSTIYRADYDFRAVGVSSGRHIVRFWYAPRSTSIGFILCGFATLGIVGYLLLRRKI